MRLWVRSLPLLSGLTIRHCHELRCRPRMRLGSQVAVALAWASSYSSDSTPSLGTSICRGSGPRNSKKKKIYIYINKETISLEALYFFWKIALLSFKSYCSNSLETFWLFTLIGNTFERLRFLRLYSDLNFSNLSNFSNVFWIPGMQIRKGYELFTLGKAFLKDLLIF